MESKKTRAIQIAIGLGLLGFSVALWTLHPIMIGLLLAGCWMIVSGLMHNAQ